MKSTTEILAYVGADPSARSPPNLLLTVPVSTHSNFSFVFVLAFARDRNRDGSFTSFRDISITPQLIGILQQANPNHHFTTSLEGDNRPWQDASNVTISLNNAIISLTNTNNTYNSDGSDLGYSQNLDATFLPVKEQVTQAMNDSPPRYQTSFWVTPFGQTYGTYTQISVDEASWIPVSDYQAYANAQAYLDKYASLAGNNSDCGSNGHEGISLGICSDPRGLQPPDRNTVWNSVPFQGAINADISCLEDSAQGNLAQDNFAIERAIQAMSLSD